jgi:hypothetical protein
VKENAVSDFHDREAEGSDEDSALAALLALHRKKQLRARADVGRSPYGQVLEHFERRGKRLAGERFVTEQLIGRVFEGTRALTPPRVQQELEISGPLGGRAAGRFRVANRTEQMVNVELVVGEAEHGRAPKLRFDPPLLELAPHSAAIVRVTVDLSDWTEACSTEVVVECRARGRRDQLWLTVTAFPAEEPAR